MYSHTKQRSPHSVEPSLQKALESPPNGLSELESEPPSSERAPRTPPAGEEHTQPSLPAPKQPFRRVASVRELVRVERRSSDASRTAGLWLLALGLMGISASAGLAAAGIATPAELWGGCLVVSSFGLALCRPSLLVSSKVSAGKGAGLSATRLSALLLLPALALVTLKLGWSATSLTELTLDPVWAWMFAALLGAEVLQSFADRRRPSRYVSRRPR